MIVPRDFVPALLGAVLLAAAPATGFAQTSPPASAPDASPADPLAPDASSADPLAPDASFADPVDLDELADETDAGLVEVSLGDWKLKNELASDLGVTVSRIPLTVFVSPELASRACPISSDDLEQQQVISPTRTCAAKTMSDALRSEVRQHLRTPDDQP